MGTNKKDEDVNVFISHRANKCDKCNIEIDKGSYIVLEHSGGAHCLSCAGLDHLVFLPSGDAALTRRARKNSKLSAVVLKFSAARKRNERQGLLVETKGLKQAKQECLDDLEIRAHNRKRDAKRRVVKDKAFIKQFAEMIRKSYPNCPEGREFEIAEHACEKHSGRVGRIADAKEFDSYTIDLAVRAHIRHQETAYDSLMITEQYDKRTAREITKDKVDEIQEIWQNHKTS